jgi:uncharacterized protein YuzE
VKPIRLEYDPGVDALAIDFPGAEPGASARMVRLDRDRVLDYDAAGRLISIELLNVSRGVDLQGLPEADVVRQALKLLAVQPSAA